MLTKSTAAAFSFAILSHTEIALGQGMPGPLVGTTVNVVVTQDGVVQPLFDLFGPQASSAQLVNDVSISPTTPEFPNSGVLELYGNSVVGGNGASLIAYENYYGPNYDVTITGVPSGLTVKSSSYSQALGNSSSAPYSYRGNIFSFMTGVGVSENFYLSAPPQPLITVTVTLGGVISNSLQPTTMFVTATPTNAMTLQQAATALGYPDGLDWVQTVTNFPQPVPPDAYQVGSSDPPHGGIHDPPPGGFKYMQQYGYNPYPFYYPAPASNIKNLQIDGTPVETNTSLTLIDHPSDPCFVGGNADLCGTTPTATGFLSFSDELVGIIPCSTPDIGDCSASGYTDSAPIPFLYKGHTVTTVNWKDNFNGNEVGGAYELGGLGAPIEPGSGSGGIVLISAAPEPSTWIMIIAGIFMVGAKLRYRRDRSQLLL